MFGFEYDKEEERKALLEVGDERGFARGFARGFTRVHPHSYANTHTVNYVDDMIRERICCVRDLLAEGTITMEALEESGCYSQEELDAIAKSLQR